MIVYKDNNAPVVMQGNSVICNFDGKEAVEVSNKVGKTLTKLGYRVEENGGSESTTDGTDPENDGRGSDDPFGDGEGGD